MLHYVKRTTRACVRVAHFKHGDRALHCTGNRVNIDILFIHDFPRTIIFKLKIIQYISIQNDGKSAQIQEKLIFYYIINVFYLVVCTLVINP